MKFGTLIELTYAINFAIFWCWTVTGLGTGEQSNIRVLALLEKSSLTLPCADVHSVNKFVTKRNILMNTSRLIVIMQQFSSCVTLLLCNLRYYALYPVGHPLPNEPVSRSTVGTNWPFCVDVPLNTNPSINVSLHKHWPTNANHR